MILQYLKSILTEDEEKIPMAGQDSIPLQILITFDRCNAIYTL